MMEPESYVEKKGNTEYQPTKCRVTKPPPPKPAANPMQFVKVAPSPLIQKAQDQVKKYEETKVARYEVRDEAEDWQQNLDSWRNNRRKRQEHIIERVVEVKKNEQEEQERAKRKNKTFNEMVEERKGRKKLTIPIYNDDDANDLSDYGIGSSSSKTNSIKDVDTDDNSSVLDERDFSNKESSNSNQSQSEDENNTKAIEKDEEHAPAKRYVPPKIQLRSTLDFLKRNTNSEESEPKEQYTYEGAIQDYRTRIRTKINFDESIFNRSQDYSKHREEVESVVPKGNICKRKVIFEAEERPKPKEEFENIIPKGSICKRREFFEGEDQSKKTKEGECVIPRGSILKRKELFESEGYTKTKEGEKLFQKGNVFKRKQMFEVAKASSSNNYVSETRRLPQTFAHALSIKDRLLSLARCVEKSRGVERSHRRITFKERVELFDIPRTDSQTFVKPKGPAKVEYVNINSSYALESDRSSSPESEIYMTDLNEFNRDTDISGKTVTDLDDYAATTNYATSTSSTELMTVSDREDSGIHTSDVSCSVSQSDEQCEDIETSGTIPKCIEKLSVVKETEKLESNDEADESKDDETYQSAPEELVDTGNDNANDNMSSSDNLKAITEEFIALEVKDAMPPMRVPKPLPRATIAAAAAAAEVKPQPIYENIDVVGESLDFMNPATKLEPPKVKPPPPPSEDQIDGEDEGDGHNFRRINSTKRIKKEIHIKRSSFLGLDEPTDDQIDPEVCIDKPPDINTFLEKEKCLYKKLQDSRGGSQDSGLEIERGRLSSDTWCSSIADSSTPIHERQDSEQTSSFTSEEDEITKKEREIIELVEKEEKSRDSDYSSQTTLSPVNTKCISSDTYDTLGSEKFDRPYFPMNTYGTNLDDEDSEVLRVEAELKQLEFEEFERQRENMLFREKLRQNRHSLENICDAGIYPQAYNDKMNYRKSMPELQVASEYRKMLPEVPSYHPSPEIDYQYRKSMPDIQHAYNRSVSDYCNNGRMGIEYRKNLGNKEHHEKERFINKLNPIEMDGLPEGNKHIRPLTRHSLHVLSAVPKPRHNDNWIQPKANPEVKSYNQHWLYQEAELRRISEQNSNIRNWQQQHHHQEVGEQRIPSRPNGANLPPTLRSVRPEHSPTKEYFEHPYLGHAQPLSYPPHVQLGDNQDKMLSVSGKKKCSNCSNELGIVKIFF